MLVMLGGAIGDAVLSVPMLAAAHQRWGGRITVVSRAEHAPIFHAARHAGLPVEHLPADREPWASLFTESDPQHQPARSLIHAAAAVINLLDLSGGPLQRNLRALCKHTLLEIQPRPPAQWQQSVAQYLARSVGETSTDLTKASLMVPIDRQLYARSVLQHLQKHAGREIALLHPGSGSLAKCYPIERMQRLATCLEEHEVDPIFFIGPDEVERFGPPFIFRLQSYAPVIGPLDLAEAIELAAATDCYIGNDSGMTHIAGALGTPTIAIFGPTSPQLWSPLGPSVQIVRMQDDAIHITTTILNLLRADPAEG